MHISVSVIVCAYSDRRLDLLRSALRSVLAQTHQPLEVIAVIDHNPGLENRIRDDFPQIHVAANEGQRGLSGARNTGMRMAKGGILAFIDDDAIAEPDWIERMLENYADPMVIGVGGGVIAEWEGGAPKWFPQEFNWVVGCSYRGLPEQVAPIRNPIGCNMSFRRKAYETIGDFREGMGRTGNDAFGCEETEYFIRLRQFNPGWKVLLHPRSLVHHHVPANRGKWAYFKARCSAEGRSKGMVVEMVGNGDGLASERDYVLQVLPAGFFRGLKETLLARDPWGAARSAWIVAGLGLTALGYARARLATSRR